MIREVRETEEEKQKQRRKREGKFYFKENQLISK